jgi:hypothetical protein
MERIGIIAASLSARNDGHTCHPYSYATKPLALRNCPPEFLGTRSLSDIDRSTAANDPRPSTSFSPEKILNVFQRIRFRFFQACGLASGHASFASSRRQCRTGS